MSHTTTQMRRAADAEPGARHVHARFELAGSNSFDLVAVVRRAVEDFTMRLGGDAELASCLGVAAHELAENAIKYADDRRATVQLDFVQRARKLELRVGSLNHAAPGCLQQLAEIARAVSGVSDRMSYYRERMLVAARRAEGSGLGLARIVGETSLDLSITVDGGLARIDATYSHDLGGSS